MRLLIPVCFAILLAAACGCAPQTDPNIAGEMLERDAAAAVADTLSFTEALDRHLALDTQRRQVARARALGLADQWRDFEREAHEAQDSQLRHWFYADNPQTYDHRWSGVGNSILELKQATGFDPSFAEGWAAMGRLCAEVGDLVSALRYLGNARLAAAAEADAGRPLEPDIQLQIFRERAWVLRDLTRWDEGLEAVAEGLAFRPGDPDLTLLKGLLLAGAGRYEEAVSVAVRMDPVEYPQYDFIYRGLKMQQSSHANNWIRAMALLAIGDPDLAYAKLGDLDLYAYRSDIAHSPRYWRDAALLAELAGDPKAAVYYGVGFVTRNYQTFYPAAANNVGPQVLDIPHPGLPVYTSFGHRFYIGGSPFSYVGLQLNQLSQGLFPGQRNEAAGRALQMLDLLQRRHIRPAVCRALRGRIFFAHDDFDTAATELGAARKAFAADGEVDAVTSLLLGLIHMRDGAFAPAEQALQEAVVADPENAVAWRSLGVVCSRLGKPTLAGQAMTRAVQLDPWNVPGLHNRGLFNFQNHQFGPALADLDRALRIDPENREVQRLRQMVLTALDQTGQDRQEVAAMTEGVPEQYAQDPAELLARLNADIDAIFTVPDSLRLSDPEAEQRIQTLTGQYLRFRDPAVRAALAMALIDHGRLTEAQQLLAPGWGVDLSPEEELMLLYADHQIGERERAAEVMRRALDSGAGEGSPFAVALAARSMRTGTDPVGTEPNWGAAHSFFHWWTTARSNLAASSMMPKPVYDMWLGKKYRQDPNLEQAVWGMGQTPVGNVSYGPGTTMTGK